MEVSAADKGEKSARVIWGFIGLAALSGPVRTFAYSAFGFTWAWPAPGGGVATAMFAGAALMLICLARREPLLTRKQWLAVAVLLIPQCLTLVLNPSLRTHVPWLSDTPWGVAFLLSVAAPLWLGLLCALDLVPFEVPRIAAAAGIAGVGAVCLMIPTEAYRVEPHQAVALVVHLAANVLLVFTWAYARPILAGAGAMVTAGSFLLLSGARMAIGGLLSGQGNWIPPDWRAVALPLVVEVVVSAVLWCLWFWLLQRMTLAAFSLGSLAMWTATTIPGFVLFGFMNWRLDMALVIAVGAIVAGLRARAGDEQPVALGLKQP